jgi:hypothetical protein
MAVLGSYCDVFTLLHVVLIHILEYFGHVGRVRPYSDVSFMFVN